MAIYNTTYNYNQPNMNFGQSMLYGAFGSLTGGMGGCMGMGGSIFSMMPGMGMMGMGGFGGYGMMGCYSDSMLGAQIGNIFSGCLMAGIGQLFEGRGGNDTEIKSDSELESEAEKYVDEKHSDLKSDIEDAKANLETAKAQAKIVNDAQNDIKLLNSDIQGLESQKKSDTGITDETKKKEIKEFNDNIDTQIKAKEKSIEEANKKIEQTRIELNRLNLGINISNNNIDTESIINAAKEKVAAAQKAREDKIDEKFNELKNEQNNSVKSSSSKQLLKAQKQAEKAEADKAKEEAKAQAKAEREEAERIENARKQTRSKFNDALNVYIKTGNVADRDKVQKVVDNINDDIELKVALQKTLNNTLPKKKNISV